MPVLPNPRHEAFAQAIFNGIVGAPDDVSIKEAIEANDDFIKELERIRNAAQGPTLLPGSHAPVIVGNIGSRCCEPLDPCVLGSEVTHWIGCSRIAGKRESLAAAPAEIQFAPRAGHARRLHPFGAAEGIERRGVHPDIAKRTLAHVPEFQPGDRFSGVTGQHLAHRCHVERAPAPSAHT